MFFKNKNKLKKILNIVIYLLFYLVDSFYIPFIFNTSFYIYIIYYYYI